MLACAAALVGHLLVLYAPSGADGGVAHLDKLVHALVFALPVLLAALAGLPWRPLLLLLAVHAPVSELLQHAALPGRSGDVLDVVADLAGLAGAAPLISWRSSPRTATPRA